MITHYLQTAWRHYLRFKYSTIANVLCLSFGMTCFLCAYSVFAYFASAESGFANADQIYVIKTQTFKNKEKNISIAGVPHFMVKSLKTDLPELKELSLTTNLLGFVTRKIVVNGKTFDGIHPVAADNAFFRIFDIPLLKGDRENVLSSPQSAVLGKDTAIKLFGSIDVVGKQFIFDGNIAVTVTGVMDALPIPTHLAMLGDTGADGKHYLNMLVSWSVYQQLVKRDYAGLISKPGESQDVLDFNLFPYAMAYLWMPNHGLTLNELNSRLQDIARRTMQGRDLSFNGDQISYAISAVPVNRALSIFADSTATLLGLPLVTLLIIIGTVILIAAIVNYVNLYTTQLVSNRNELHVQRLLGAARAQLAIQCFVETFIVSAVALILAVLFFRPLKSPIAENSFVEFDTQWLTGWHYWLALACLVVMVSVVSATYPIAYVTQIKPKQEQRTRNGRWSPRSAIIALVATQFSVTGALLIFLLVVGQQNTELKKLALGHIDDPIVIINNAINENNVSYPVLASTLKQYPQIKSIATINGLWLQGFSFEPNTVSTQKGSAATRHRVDIKNISFGFLNTMNMKLLAGRDFDQNRDRIQPEISKSTSVKELMDFVPNVIVDRSLVDALGYKNANEIIGKELYRHQFDQSIIRVIGVVENIYLGMMGTHNVGTIFMVSKDGGFPLIRIDKRDINGGLRAINTVWEQLAPNVPINRKFLKEQYTTPALIARAFWVLSFLLILAITISLLGMIGITLHTLTRRTREISIRKSLGASSTDILKLLLSFFVKPVAIANILLAWPLGYLISRAYLSLFPYRITLTPLPFVISLLTTLAIVCIAVGTQSLRAARRKPAEVLRYE